MKADYHAVVYNRSTKRYKLINLSDMDLIQLAEWIKAFEHVKDFEIANIVNVTLEY